jgi:hypothetical protein
MGRLALYGGQTDEVRSHFPKLDCGGLVTTPAWVVRSEQRNIREALMIPRQNIPSC